MRLRCLLRGHRWNSYTFGALAPNRDGAYRPAELTILACDHCGKVK